MYNKLISIIIPVYNAGNYIEDAIQSANCLNICPVIPPINDTGTNTAIRTSDVATTAPKTSSIVISVASFGLLPSCICL